STDAMTPFPDTGEVLGSIWCGGTGDDIIEAFGAGHQCIDGEKGTDTCLYDFHTAGTPGPHDVVTVRNCEVGITTSERPRGGGRGGGRGGAATGAAPRRSGHSPLASGAGTASDPSSSRGARARPAARPGYCREAVRLHRALRDCVLLTPPCRPKR